MHLIEARVDFMRSVRTRCGMCRFEQELTSLEYDDWSESDQECPRCSCDRSVVNEHGPAAATLPIAALDDPARDASKVWDMEWWHTSTHSEWPLISVDAWIRQDASARLPASSDASPGADDRFRGVSAVHIGTYEAAIHNMFRRMANEDDRGKEFFLYRVALAREAPIEAEMTRDRADRGHPRWFQGGRFVSERIERYANEFEQPGSISLALRPEATSAVQRLRLPLPLIDTPAWIEDAVDRLKGASTAPLPPPEPGGLERQIWELRRGKGLPSETERMKTQRLVLQRLAEELPAGRSLRGAIEGSFDVNNDVGPRAWCENIARTLQVITYPDSVMKEARQKPIRYCGTGVGP